MMPLLESPLQNLQRICSISSGFMCFRNLDGWVQVFMETINDLKLKDRVYFKFVSQADNGNLDPGDLFCSICG